jgi:CheY-like chemotaxis protein
MTIDQQPAQERGAPHEEFIKQVKDALKYLYDLPHLQRHPLAQVSDPSTERPTESPGQRLRRDIIAAIESLSPGSDVPFHAPRARLYNVLHLHYVEGMTVREVAHELGISMRQLYRDLRRGEESTATVLWSRRPARASQEPDTVQPSSIQAEMARLETHPRPTDVRALLQRAQEAVGRMASQYSVVLDIEVASEPAIASTDPVVAQQVLVNMLSHAVQQTQPGSMRVTLTTGEEQVSLTLRYTPKAETADISVFNSVAAQLVERLGWQVRQEDEPEGNRIIALNMATFGSTLLVIDDNEGLIELLKRYLTDQACRIVGALGGQEGLRMAQELDPDTIVLDVMMPEMDGWELLQRIRTSPHTADIPVIICSVFDDPELAYSLGASLFLPKPVSRENVLAALRRVGVL